MKSVARRRYNILFTTSFGHMMGGGQWSLYYMIKYLNKKIFHPIVLCPEAGELAMNMRKVGAEVLYLDVGRIRYLNLQVIRKLIAIIKSRKIDIIHTDSSTETFYAGIAAWIMHIPLIWHIRVSVNEWFMDRFLSMFCVRLILVANAIRSRFKWLEKTGKIVVVYNGIDLDEFDSFPSTSSMRHEWGVDKNTVLLGCIGRIERTKGQEYLIAAMQHITNAKLILVGSEDKKYLKRLTQLCEKFKVSQHIIFVGYRKDIPRFLKEIDIVVFPTLSEGFSRVILEAMAAAKPVIATDIAGNPEAVTDGITGYIVPAKNIAALTTRIRDLATDKAKRKKMGQAGRKRIEQFFTIQQNVQSVQEVYFDILANNKQYLDEVAKRIHKKI